MDDRDLCSPLRFLGALSSLGARHFYRRRAAHRSGSPNMWSQQPYPDLTDVLGLSAKRASRRNIRRIASKLLPLKSGRRRNISLRSAAAALPWSDVLATVPHYPPHSTHTPSAVPKHIAGSARCDFIQLGGGGGRGTIYARTTISRGASLSDRGALRVYAEPVGNDPNASSWLSQWPSWCAITPSATEILRDLRKP